MKPGEGVRGENQHPRALDGACGHARYLCSVGCMDSPLGLAARHLPLFARRVTAVETRFAAESEVLKRRLVCPMARSLRAGAVDGSGYAVDKCWIQSEKSGS